jgi:hypothetical protein
VERWAEYRRQRDEEDRQQRVTVITEFTAGGDPEATLHALADEMRYRLALTVDYRKLLKDTIRGMIWAWDVPAAPGAVDADGEQTESSRAELEVFFDLVAEVVGEQGEPRPSVLGNIAQLESEYL